MYDARTAFIYSQVAAEKIGMRILNAANKHGKQVHIPNTEDLVRRYSKLHDEIEIAIDKIDEELEEDNNQDGTIIEKGSA